MARPFALGLMAALLGNIIWGCFPFYFRELESVSAIEILDHRIWASVVFMLFWLPFGGRASSVWTAITTPRSLALLTVTSALIVGNWLVYIYTVTTEQVLQASLGYYLSPLIAVGLSWLVLRERQSSLQLIAVAIAVLSVAAKILVSGTVPTFALILAFSFSLYSLIHKQLDVGPISGLFIEACLALPFALAHMAWLQSQGELQFLFLATPQVNLFILGLGAVSIVPLYLFNLGAKALPLSLASMLFFLVPTLLFLFSVVFFGEALYWQDLIIFGGIWLAVGLYLAPYFQKSQKQGAVGA